MEVTDTTQAETADIAKIPQSNEPMSIGLCNGVPQSTVVVRLSVLVESWTL